jgi:hypothetical protein
VAVAQLIERAGTESIETLALAVFAQHLFGVALDCRGGGALTNRGGLLVVLTLTHLGNEAGFFARALEATQGNVKGLVFFNLNRRHSSVLWSKNRAKWSRTRFEGAQYRREGIILQSTEACKFLPLFGARAAG